MKTGYDLYKRERGSSCWERVSYIRASIEVVERLYKDVLFQGSFDLQYEWEVRANG